MLTVLILVVFAVVVLVLILLVSRGRRYHGRNRATRR